MLNVKGQKEYGVCKVCRGYATDAKMRPCTACKGTGRVFHINVVFK